MMRHVHSAALLVVLKVKGQAMVLTAMPPPRKNPRLRRRVYARQQQEALTRNIHKNAKVAYPTAWKGFGKGVAHDAQKCLVKAWHVVNRFRQKTNSMLHCGTRAIATKAWWQGPPQSSMQPSAAATKSPSRPSTIVLVPDNSNHNNSVSVLQVDDWKEAPVGTRWAISHPQVDFSGTWAPVIDQLFLQQYSHYLSRIGISLVMRQVCCRFCQTTREHVEQQDGGRCLHFTTTSPAGSWRRSLTSSGTDNNGRKDTFQVVHSEFLDPDRALVQVEAWWQDQGTVHVSWLRNTPRVQGGEFESRRYLQKADDGVVELICESTFHPAAGSSKFQPASVRWRYRKVE